MQVKDIQNIVKRGVCVGCGVCASTKNSPFYMALDATGRYQPKLIEQNTSLHSINLSSSSVCPFDNAAVNEDYIASKLFGAIPEIKKDKYLGYYVSTFVGSVNSDIIRLNSGSGGMVTWLLIYLLENKFIDGVIHVIPTGSSCVLFRYGVSKTKEEILNGAKSKYYPVEISKVIQEIRNTSFRYAIVGVPCFIKGIRLLALEDKDIREKIKYFIGLVCGHLKTDRYAKSLAWQVGISPDKIQSIDFRVKLSEERANRYGVRITGEIGGEVVDRTIKLNKTIVGNWGYGLFRYLACDFCDDVMAETADISFGDAWLPEYIDDYRGTNIVVIRNPQIQSIINSNTNTLNISKISAEKIYESQIGGFRHRREGLSYRLFLQTSTAYRIEKRVLPDNSISRRRKKIYDLRTLLLTEGNVAYDLAIKHMDFNVFKSTLEKKLKKFDRLYRANIIKRVYRKILLTIFRILKSF